MLATFPALQTAAAIGGGNDNRAISCRPPVKASARAANAHGSALPELGLPEPNNRHLTPRRITVSRSTALLLMTPARGCSPPRQKLPRFWAIDDTQSPGLPSPTTGRAGKYSRMVPMAASSERHVPSKAPPAIENNTAMAAMALRA